jgi:glycerol-3-phosphate responsive antiterminator
MSYNFYEVMGMTQIMSKHVACHVDIITALSNKENVFRLMFVLRIHAQVLMRLFTVC